MLDILLVDALGELDYSDVAEAAQRVFAERATHGFPPSTVLPPEWHPELEALARELDFPLKRASEIEQRFGRIVEHIAGAIRDHR